MNTIVPKALVELQAKGDGRANARMFQVMMGMQRLDVEALQRAYLGDEG